LKNYFLSIIILDLYLLSTDLTFCPNT